MLIGIGNDIVEMTRVSRILQGTSGNRFVQRVLHEEERAQLAARPQRRTEYVAGRFAAKEAVVKALGCGIGRIVGFQDIAIIPDEQGRPQAQLCKQAVERLGYVDRDLRVHVSISHSEHYATAMAVAEVDR